MDSVDKIEGLQILDSRINEEKYHNDIEVGNIYKCSKIEKEWLSDSEWPSSHYVKQLHFTLFDKIESYKKKGTSPIDPGIYRLDDVRLIGRPKNFYARGLDVGPLMTAYTQELDNILFNLPHTPLGHIEDIIHKAAWAYYVFERIHPFLDGNGRI